ncbi:MAG TPA: hypothetical protein ENK31_02345 [Nannocystis exedens]|nr:hypothetical protein [Nannocystis exedens]
MQRILDHFEFTLKNQVAELQTVAKCSAPGGVGDWEQIVAHFGLPAIERKERVKQAGLRRHHRGAFSEEFEAVMGVLAAQAGLVLQQLERQFGPALANHMRFAEFVRMVGTLAADQRAAYEDAIQVRTGTSGLASIFANASATSKLTPWANLEYDPQMTLSCPSCGSPQRTRLIFDCEYCGSSLFVPQS